MLIGASKKQEDEKMKKRIVALWLGLVMTVLMLGTASATEESGYTDVPEDHWAKDAIDLMTEQGIISGYDGYFRPEDTVSRAEFAKMLVNTLDLEEKNPSTASFVDVGKDAWYYTYVETAKAYLTGYTSGGGYKFKPDEPSVREDMAVAVMKGLYAKGMVEDPSKTNIGILEGYTDEAAISSNLRTFVAAAINEGIMVGSNNKFEPMDNLTRAEAATLLARLMDDEEKIVFDEESKVVFEEEASSSDTTVDSNSLTPILTAQVKENEVYFDWSGTASEGFKYYKVVLSLGDSTPSYSENGYAAAISRNSETQWSVESGDAYYGTNDFGGVIKGGKTYYAAITAVYEDGKYTSNVIRVSMPGTYTEPSGKDRTPELSYTRTDEGVILDWTATTAEGFSYYKVVLSQSYDKPYYPDYGYLTYISDASKSTYTVKTGTGYNNGSKGGITKVESEGYYMTITACYKDGMKYTSNAVYVTVP